MAKKIIEKKVVERWQEDKDVFNSLETGDLVKLPEHCHDAIGIVCSRERTCSATENNLAMISGRYSKNTVEALYFDWSGNRLNFDYRTYFSKEGTRNRNDMHEKKWVYEKINQMLTEAGL